jgi:hypothetical protein
MHKYFIVLRTGGSAVGQQLGSADADVNTRLYRLIQPLHTAGNRLKVANAAVVLAQLVHLRGLTVQGLTSYQTSCAKIAGRGLPMGDRKHR